MLKRWMVLPAAVLAFGIAAPAAAPTLTEQEVKVRIAEAKNAADHVRIAQYYRDEAERHESMARAYEKQARTASNAPAPADSKQPLAPRGAAHNRLLAQRAHKKAYEARAQAVLHEDMARQAAGL